MSVCIVKPSQYWDKNEANCIEIISDLNHPNPETNKHCRIQGGLWNETHFVFNRITHRVSILKSRDVMFSWYLIVTSALLTYLHSLSSTSVQTTGMIKNGEFLLILRLKWKLAKRTLKKNPKTWPAEALWSVGKFYIHIFFFKMFISFAQQQHGC